jgi:hypothetical protein
VAEACGVTDVLLDAFVDNVQRTHLVYERLGFTRLDTVAADWRYSPSDPTCIMTIDCPGAEDRLPPRLRDHFGSVDPLIDHGG